MMPDDCQATFLGSSGIIFGISRLFLGYKKKPKQVKQGCFRAFNRVFVLSYVNLCYINPHSYHVNHPFKLKFNRDFFHQLSRSTFIFVKNTHTKNRGLNVLPNFTCGKDSCLVSWFIFVKEDVKNNIHICICRICPLRIIFIIVFVFQKNYALHSALHSCCS